MEPSVGALLEAHGLRGATERPFPNDGWSGSSLTLLERGARRAILKRTSMARDWIVRATRDGVLREAAVAEGPLALPHGIAAPYLGVARDAGGAALLMPDLSAMLVRWTEGAEPIGTATLDLVLRRVAALHAAAWWPPDAERWWCDPARRLTLLTRPAAERYLAGGLPVAERFLAGWDAFDRQAPAASRELVEGLSRDPGPLLRALEGLPAAGLHGDLKLANVAVLDEAVVGLIDWQLTLRAPAAVELGWLLVSNVALLPEPPDAIVERYLATADPANVGDPGAQADLTWIVGLLLRGWRKGLDAEAGVRTGWGATGPDDLAWWCRRAAEAAHRRL